MILNPKLYVVLKAAHNLSVSCQLEVIRYRVHGHKSTALFTVGLNRSGELSSLMLTEVQKLSIKQRVKCLNQENKLGIIKIRINLKLHIKFYSKKYGYNSCNQKEQ